MKEHQANEGTSGRSAPSAAQDGLTKKVYRKPGISYIDLTAGEVLATGCKTTTGGTAATASPCSAGSCSAVGS